MEDWPALPPRRVVSASPIQEVMRETGAELRKLSTNTHGERYPKLGDLTKSPDLRSIYHSPIMPAVPTNTPETTSKSLRKGVSTPELSASKKTTVSMVDPFDESPSKRASNLSAIAASLEKAKNQDSGAVRQTRTSSLRARLSAGEIVRDRNSKITGFTDFTQVPISSIPRRESLSKTTAHVPAKTIKSQSSIESIGRAPAKFIAGARRVARRASRSGMNEEASTAPTMDKEMKTSTIDRTNTKSVKDGRRSSIPVAKAIVSSIPVLAGTPDSRRTTSSSVRTSTAFDEPEQMQAIQVAMQHLGDDKITVTDVRGKPMPGNGTMGSGSMGLGSIEESPRHAYKTRRLSTKSPEFGPTLTISPSARRYMMGPAEDKENASPKRRARVSDGGKISAATKKRLERPSSIHSPSSPRMASVNSQTREKKTRSVEIAAVGNGRQDSSNADGGLSKNPSNASTADRPYYDADEGTTPTAADNRASYASIAQEEGWISPLKPHFNAGDTYGDTTPTSIKTCEHEDYDPFNYSTNTPREQKAKITPLLNGLKTPTSTYTPSTAYPPRSSSHEHKYATKTISVNATTRENGPLTPRAPATPPKDFIRRQNQLGSTRGHGSSQLDVQATAPPTLNSSALNIVRSAQNSGLGSANTNSKRNSIVSSASSLQQSTSRSRFNIKSLFKKGSQEGINKPGKRGSVRKIQAEQVQALSARRKASTPPSIRTNGWGLGEDTGDGEREGKKDGMSGLPRIEDVHPVHRPTLQPSPRNSTFGVPTLSPMTNEVMATPPPPSNTPAPLLVRASPRASANPPSNIPAPALTHDVNKTDHPIPTTAINGNVNLPSSSSNESPDHLGSLTNRVITLLEQARLEPPSSPRKKKLLDLGKVLVDVITRAREAEAAVKECQIALARAEVAREGCLDGVREVERMLRADGV